MPPCLPLRVEAISLRSLVHHAEALDAAIGLEAAYARFRTRKVDYMAVVRQGRVIGLCARGQIGFILGSRFGFALYSQNPVETAMVTAPLIVEENEPVRRVLDRALARTGEGFHEDVVLVDPPGRLLGLIRAESLAQLQSRLVAEQLDALREQHEALSRQNLELFRAIHAARQSQSLYLGLFEGHTLGVALLDAEGRIHEHNRRLAELLGFEDESASLVSLPAWMDARDRPAFIALLRAQTEGSAAAATREFTVQIPSRGPRVFRCSTGWIKETGQVCACLDDITDQRVLERNLLRQEKQTLLDTLVGGIAHELNNKLTPVQGFAELLTDEVVGDARQHLRFIRQSVAEAAAIIRQLLQLSKPSSPVLEPVDLCTLVPDTLQMLRFQARAARCETRTALPPHPVWVLGDAGQLKQIVLNLVLNAFQAIESGRGGVVTIALEARAGRAALRVEDNGCGIPPENLGRIFDPFFTTKGPERGTGLGLSICFSLVRQHGGEIAVQSRPGAGTHFEVTLPLEPAAPAKLEARAPHRRGGEPSRKAHVLVAEDDDVVRLLLQEVLHSQLGWHVDLAANGHEALASIRKRPYDLVISDVQMPGMTGAELYQQACSEAPTLAKRFAFVTGYVGGSDTAAEISRWNVPVISKPFTSAQLLEVCLPLVAGLGERTS